MGPLISDEQYEKVMGYLEAGVAEGATVAAGGDRVGERGYFVTADRLHRRVSEEMSIQTDEIFGPS